MRPARAGVVMVGIDRRLVGYKGVGLPTIVQRFHFGPDSIRGAGHFDVQRGSHLLARLVAGLLRLPHSGHAVPVQLAISRALERETWRRTFGGRSLTSHQYVGEDGALLERTGPIELRFHLEFDDARLRFRHVSTAVRAGFIRVPLPRPLVPSVSGSASATADGRLHVAVRVTAPLLGLLLSYEGQMDELP